MKPLPGLLTPKTSGVTLYIMRDVYTLENVRQALRLKTITQARNRVNLIKRELVAKGNLSYGRNNRMELTADAMSLLKKMEQLAQDGTPQREAALQLATPDDTSARLDALEQELAEIKSILASGFSLTILPRQKLE